MAVIMFGQGAQYATRPDRPLNSAALTHLRPIGDVGWQCIGALVIATALALLFDRTRTAAFWAAAGLQSLLATVQLAHLYWPSLSLMWAGLASIEIAQVGLVHRRARRAQTRRGG